MSEPTIIYVPGIKPKPPAAEHRAALWRCLVEGVRRVDDRIGADIARHPACFTLVSWAHVFYESQRDIALDLPGIERLIAQSGPAPQDIEEASCWRRRLKQQLYLLSDAFPPLFELAADPNMRATLEETRRYFANWQDAAVRVRHMVADTLIEAWQADRRVLLMGHSLGSVIAFDVLWELSHRFWAPGRVDLFLSIGSPLGLKFVRARLLGAREKGRRRYPTNIRRWTNLAALGELTALDRRMGDIWGEMSDLGLVEDISDRLDLQTYFRGSEGLNVHKCYGYMINPVLSRALIQWWQEV
jgi:hypothetical protein